MLLKNVIGRDSKGLFGGKMEVRKMKNMGFNTMLLYLENNLGTNSLWLSCSYNCGMDYKVLTII